MEKKEHFAELWKRMKIVGSLMDTLGFQLLFYFVAGWFLALAPYTGLLYLIILLIFIYRDTVRGGIVGWIGAILPIIYMTLVGIEEKLAMWQLDIFDWRTFLVLPGRTANAGVNTLFLSPKVNFQWWNIIVLFLLCGISVAIGCVCRQKYPEKYEGAKITFFVKRENWKLAGIVLAVFLVLAIIAGFAIAGMKAT